MAAATFTFDGFVIKGTAIERCNVVRCRLCRGEGHLQASCPRRTGHVLRFAFTTAVGPSQASAVRDALNDAKINVHSVFVGPFDGHRGANHFVHVFAEPPELLQALSVISDGFGALLLTQPALTPYASLGSSCYLCGGTHAAATCVFGRPTASPEALVVALRANMARLISGEARVDQRPARSHREPTAVRRLRGDVARTNNWCINFALGGSECCIRSSCRFFHADEQTIATAVEAVRANLRQEQPKQGAAQVQQQELHGGVENKGEPLAQQQSQRSLPQPLGPPEQQQQSQQQQQQLPQQHPPQQQASQLPQQQQRQGDAKENKGSTPVAAASAVKSPASRSLLAAVAAPATSSSKPSASSDAKRGPAAAEAEPASTSAQAAPSTPPAAAGRKGGGGGGSPLLSALAPSSQISPVEAAAGGKGTKRSSDDDEEDDAGSRAGSSSKAQSSPARTSASKHDMDASSDGGGWESQSSRNERKKQKRGSGNRRK